MQLAVFWISENFDMYPIKRHFAGKKHLYFAWCEGLKSLIKIVYRNCRLYQYICSCSFKTYPERRRERPCEVLATCSPEIQGANSCLLKSGEDKEDQRIAFVFC